MKILPFFPSSVLTLYFIAFAVLLVSIEASVDSFITPSDKKKLLSVITKSLIVNDEDYSSSYYAAKGFNSLKESIVLVLKRDNCDHLKKHFKNEHTSEVIYQAVTAWSLLQCSGKLHTDTTVKVSTKEYCQQN